MQAHLNNKKQASFTATKFTRYTKSKNKKNKKKMESTKDHRKAQVRNGDTGGNNQTQVKVVRIITQSKTRTLTSKIKQGETKTDTDTRGLKLNLMEGRRKSNHKHNKADK